MVRATAYLCAAVFWSASSTLAAAGPLALSSHADDMRGQARKLPTERPSETHHLRMGQFILTGGTLDFGDHTPVPPSRRAGRSVPEASWLETMANWLLPPEPQPAARPRTQQRASPRRPVEAGRPAASRPIAAPRLPPAVAKSADVTDAARAAEPSPAPGEMRSATVITGAIDRAPQQPSTLPDLSRDHLDASLVGEAGVAQAREDLVKLELARRTYDETRLSGAAAFDSRLDWRVLERGRDAWSATELSAANAAGFEANTYINDTTRTIVVAIAGSQDLRRDFLENNIWQALIQAQAPQQFYLAKSYVRSVQARYQAAGYVTECVGHSLGGGACAYAAAELGVRGIVVNPISAGQLGDLARYYVTNYVVDGDIAAAVYRMRGNELSGDVQTIRSDREAVRAKLKARYGPLSGPILVIRDLQNAVKVHQIERALDIIAAYANASRVK